MTIRSKRGDNVKPREHKLGVNFAKHCLREICKKQYEIEYRGKPVVYAEALKRLHVRTKYRSQRCYGSAGGIDIDVRYLRKPKRIGISRPEAWYLLHEYDSFANDPVIGEFETTDKELVLLAGVAHEVAHHIQMLYGAQTLYLKKTYRKAHGVAFKTIYRELRRTLVNPYIQNQQAA